MKKVKESIRRFCSIPLKERYKSEDAIIVEQLCGYPLINTMEKARHQREKSDLASSNTRIRTDDDEKEIERKLGNSVKREIVTKMGPLISVMEAQKKQDIELMEAGTGCRVQKRKGGKFKYINMANDVKVPTSEYERRYVSVLKLKRLAREEERKNDLAVAVVEEDSTSDESLPATLEEEQDSLSCKNKGAASIDKCMDEQNKCSSPQVAMETSAMVTSEPSNDQLDETEIPSRDDISDDPEIAAAQNTLFDAFDSALQKYSDTILEIKGRRARGLKKEV